MLSTYKDDDDAENLEHEPAIATNARIVLEQLALGPANVCRNVMHVGVDALHRLALLGDHARELREDLAEFGNRRLDRLDSRRALLDVVVLPVDQLHLHEVGSLGALNVEREEVVALFRKGALLALAVKAGAGTGGRKEERVWGKSACRLWGSIRAPLTLGRSRHSGVARSVHKLLCTILARLHVLRAQLEYVLEAQAHVGKSRLEHHDDVRVVLLDLLATAVALLL
jgi:hypothetical protein